MSPASRSRQSAKCSKTAQIKPSMENIVLEIQEKEEEMAQSFLMNEKAGSRWHTLRLSPHETGA